MNYKNRRVLELIIQNVISVCFLILNHSHSTNFMRSTKTLLYATNNTCKYNVISKVPKAYQYSRLPTISTNLNCLPPFLLFNEL